jgi:lysozyme
MNLDLAKQWITRWEGTRTTCYKDTKDIPTIGVGYNLTCNGAQECIAALGLNYDSVLDGSVSLTDDQIDQLLDGSIQIALTSARALVPNLDDLPENQQVVVLDLAFNMGQHTLSEFVNTLSFIKNQDWPHAASNLQQSAWFHQVGTGPQQRGGADVAVLGNTATPQQILNPQPVSA